jgi:hypothetical protein
VTINPFAAPAVGEEPTAPLVAGPTYTPAIRLCAVVIQFIIVPGYCWLWWTGQSKAFPLRFFGIEVGFWLAATFMLWFAIYGIVMIMDKTRVFADSIDSRSFFRQHVDFQEVAYAIATNPPPAIHFVKHDGKVVKILGGNESLRRAFEEIAARFPPPS